jgi:hypothetical protein
MNQIKYIHTDRMHNTQAAFAILPFMFNYIHPQSVIDIGCGNGSWFKATSELGLKNGFLLVKQPVVKLLKR